MIQKRLEGRCAVITGAAGGIGIAAAPAFVKEGAMVSLVDLVTSRKGEARRLCPC